jgi:hypothetical protein
VAVLDEKGLENCPEDRRNTEVWLRPPTEQTFGGLSGGLRDGPAGLAAIDDRARVAKSEELYGVGFGGDNINLLASGRPSPDMPKTATASEGLTVLENGEPPRDSQVCFSPKTATCFCRDSLNHAALQQNAVETKFCETSRYATRGYPRIRHAASAARRSTSGSRHRGAVCRATANAVRWHGAASGGDTRRRRRPVVHRCAEAQNGIEIAFSTEGA